MDIDKIEVEINPDYTMMKRLKNGLYLSQEQIDIMEEYGINYMNFSSLSELILEIEDIFEETNDDVLSNLLDVLSERDYYENYKK